MTYNDKIVNDKGLVNEIVINNPYEINNQKTLLMNLPMVGWIATLLAGLIWHEKVAELYIWLPQFWQWERSRLK